MSEGISDDKLRSDSPAHERHRARRTVLVGLVVFVVCAMLTFSPLLLGRGGLNRFIVAFSLGLAGVLMALGISLVIGRKVTSRGRHVFERALVQRTVAVMPVLCAAVVTLVGVGLTLLAVGRV